MEQDFLDEIIEESTKRNPEFPSLMEEARQYRAQLKALSYCYSKSRNCGNRIGQYMELKLTKGLPIDEIAAGCDLSNEATKKIQAEQSM